MEEKCIFIAISFYPNIEILCCKNVVFDKGLRFVAIKFDDSSLTHNFLVFLSLTLNFVQREDRLSACMVCPKAKRQKYASKTIVRGHGRVVVGEQKNNGNNSNNGNNHVVVLWERW